MLQALERGRYIVAAVGGNLDVGDGGLVKAGLGIVDDSHGAVENKIVVTSMKSR